jgi:hypothetical protein
MQPCPDGVGWQEKPSGQGSASEQRSRQVPASRQGPFGGQGRGVRQDSPGGQGTASWAEQLAPSPGMGPSFAPGVLGISPGPGQAISRKSAAMMKAYRRSR